MNKHPISLQRVSAAIKDLALYGGISRQEYATILPDILKRNRDSLRVSAGMCALMFLGLLIGSFFSESLARAQILYGLMTLGCGGIFVLSLTERTSRGKAVWILWYLLYLLFGTYAVVLNTLIRPELSAVTLCVFLTAGPLLIVDRPARILSLQVLLLLEFLLFAHQGKDSYLAFTDSVNLICCMFLGFGVYIRLNRVNLQEMLQARHLRMERDTDRLTGLLNKAAIQERIGARLASASGGGALVMIDLDGFKHINDTYGHVFGDTVLHQAAACIREIMPDNSLCGRFGGDEFLVFLPEVTKEALSELLDALLRSGEETIRLPLSDTSFGMSIGAVMDPGKRFEELLPMADEAMYQVKKSRKNGWKIV